MYWVLQLDKQYQANYYRPRYADSRTSSDIDSLCHFTGSPPIWKNKPLPFRVQSDHEISYIDQNGHRLQFRSLLPLFRAVDVVAEEDSNADIDWREVDIVTDRNGLRKLLRWIDDRGDGDRPREFRIDLQLAGDSTILMSRWEKATWAPPGAGFGFSFEEETTVPAPGCEKNTGHHRIVQYVSIYSR